jgi:hypothetical protein
MEFRKMPRLILALVLGVAACKGGGVTASDNDNDGFEVGIDCNDDDESINPDATESCDGVDENCDELVDNDAADASSFFADADADGYGDPESTPDVACEATDGHVADSTDCDDGEANVNPGASEICDAIDEDCDGELNNGLTMTTWYDDADGDGFGSGAGVESCDQPSGAVADDGDCDDADADVNPDAVETCNSTDDDCDGATDEDPSDGSTYYADADGDGYGDAAAAVNACAQPSDTVVDATDCDDTDTAVHPTAVEHCDNIDEDCDTLVDNAAVDANQYFADLDADGYGDPNADVFACVTPANHVSNGDDCDDTRATANPLAPEVCNGRDDDCNTIVDDNFSAVATWYDDVDQDGYGDDATGVESCTQPSGTTDVGGDCADTDPAIHPDQVDTCNTIDDDCDGLIDAADPVTDAPTFYVDADGDTYGDIADTVGVIACRKPAGYARNTGDCDDTNRAVHPGATEDCANAIDDDCDGLVDGDQVGCRVITWTEAGSATVVPGTSYTGQSSWSYDFLDPNDGPNLCTYEFDVNDVGTPPTMACTGCDFAFTVEFTNSVGTNGDCTALGLDDGAIDGTQYGYGFNGAYTYSSQTFPALMYYVSGYGWYAVSTDATYSGQQFDYSWLINYYYY